GSIWPETRCNDRLLQGRNDAFALAYPAQKGPDLTARAFSLSHIKKSGGRLVVLGRGRLDRLGGLGRDLLAELGELLGLGGVGLELLLGVRGPQLERGGRGLHAEQLL